MGVKNRLLEIRLSRGYKKQKDFADFLGISQYQYNRYENNVVQPSIEILYNISKKLDCKMDDIIYGESNL
jgi:transcriptional regulator with XRE-family HTH domain